MTIPESKSGSRFYRFWENASKQQKLMLLLTALFILGAALSLLVRHTLLQDDPMQRSRIAVVAPISGSSAEIGQSIRRGVELFIAEQNQHSGNRKLAVMVLDGSDPGKADVIRHLTDEPLVLGAIGQWSVGSAMPPANLPAISIADSGNKAEGQAGYVLGSRLPEQARFLANYARNVMQQKLMYVVQEDSPYGSALAGPFSETFGKFGVAVRQSWIIPPEGMQSEAALAQFVQDLKEKADVGALFIAASPPMAARVLQAMHEAGSHLSVFGPDGMAGNGFLSLIGKDKAGVNLVNGAMVASPLLLDTANAAAQNFKAAYQHKYGDSPDWVAAYAYDAAHMMAESLTGATDGKNGDIRRQAVAAHLMSLNSESATSQGVTGALWFDAEGRGVSPIQVGVYNGRDIISAPVQLQPILKGILPDYIAELKAGRVLYVNDRFMYKTNVVYVGTRINDVSDVDELKQTATVDFDVWFRYAGDVAPQNVQFLNAAEPITLDKPDAQGTVDNVNYRRYHLRKKFAMDFAGTPQVFGSHVAGVSFRHRDLNRSNLLYVVDVLGMPSGEALLTDIRDRHAVNSHSGWDAVKAWVSQDMLRQDVSGDPKYIGFSGDEPLFSRIDTGVLLEESGLSARDLFSSDDFFYLGIFGLLGALLARSMDLRRWGRYWSQQAWGLRAVFWPMLLLATGNVGLDWAYQNLSPTDIRPLLILYHSLWCLQPAYLLDMAIRRFVWVPLEERSGRRIPNIIKIVVSAVIFALAGAGILAFVFNQTLTSVLATSGVLAMIVGLAVQANIANLFSGIILNIERPFKVGDKVKVNSVTGTVHDITWRTTRIEADDGQLVCFANAKVSEAEIHNFSVIPNGLSAEALFQAPVSLPPDRMLSILTEAAEECEHIAYKGDLGNGPQARYKGVIAVEGHWVASYKLGFRVSAGWRKSLAVQDLQMAVWRKLAAEGIPLDASAVIPVLPGVTA